MVSNWLPSCGRVPPHAIKSVLPLVLPLCHAHEHNNRNYGMRASTVQKYVYGPCEVQCDDKVYYGHTTKTEWPLTATTVTLDTCNMLSCYILT